jgi:hypothetical protein
MKQAMEVVVFRAKTDTTPEQLQSAALAVTPVLSSMPGFISMEISGSGLAFCLSEISGLAPSR